MDIQNTNDDSQNLILISELANDIKTSENNKSINNDSSRKKSIEISNSRRSSSQQFSNLDVIFDQDGIRVLTNKINIPTNKNITIEYKIAGGEPPYHDIELLKNNDDDPIVILKNTDTFDISSNQSGNFIIYVIATDSNENICHKQLIVEVTRQPLTALITPDIIHMNINDTACVTLLYFGGNFQKIEETGWLIDKSNGYSMTESISACDGVTNDNTDKISVSIKALKEGTFILSGYVSDSSTTCIANVNIIITNDDPWLNFLVSIITKIKTINDSIFDYAIRFLVKLKNQKNCVTSETHA